MLKSTTISLMLAVGVVAIAAPAVAKEDKAKAAAAAPAGKPSKGAVKTLVEIQKLAETKDWAGVKAKIAEADVLPGRNSYDEYFINQFRYNAGTELKDNAMIIAGLEGMFKSEFVAADQKPKILRNLLGLADQAKDTVKARAYADQYLQLVPDDVNVQTYLAEQMMKAKDYAGADARLVQIIKTAEAAGKPPEEYVYTRLAGARQLSKSPLFSESLLMLVKNYPTPRNWNFLLEDFQGRSGLTGRAGLDLYRLMHVTGALSTTSAALEAAQTALDSGVPGDAKAILEKAQAAGLLESRKTDAAALLKEAKTTIASEEAPAKQEAAATTAERLGAVGQLYLSLANYPKATEIFSKALAKGVRNKPETTLRLGISQLMGGDTAAAKTTWAGLGSDPKLAELSRLWALYADRK
jgi:tetratricopeptide (TPR) repeat protein